MHVRWSCELQWSGRSTRAWLRHTWRPQLSASVYSMHPLRGGLFKRPNQWIPPSASPKVRAWTPNKCDVNLLLRWTFQLWVVWLKISTALVEIASHNHNTFNKTTGWWHQPGAIVKRPLASQWASLSFMLNEMRWGWGGKEEFYEESGLPD